MLKSGFLLKSLVPCLIPLLSDGSLPKPKQQQQFFVEKQPLHGISNHLDYSFANVKLGHYCSPVS